MQDLNTLKRYSGRIAISIGLTLGLASAAVAQPGGMQVTVPFVDGMSITTSNSVANIEVRVKGMGPGTCAVTFAATGGGTASFNALPLVWSPWMTLQAHIGSTTQKLSNDVKCDTGVVAEVRYYK